MCRGNALADKQEMSPDLDSSIQSGANEAFAELDLVDLNVILHRADGEEKDATGESQFTSSPSALPRPSSSLCPPQTSPYHGLPPRARFRSHPLHN
jgi:hypothetical protein